MRRLILVIMLILALGLASGWALQAMGVVDFELLLLERLQTVPAFSDRVALYRLGQSRREEIVDLQERLEREAQLAEAARLQFEAEKNALAEAWEEIERIRVELEGERAQLDREWQALYEARSVEENIAQLVILYEQMKPDEVAAVAGGLEDPLLIQILLEMEPKRAAALLSKLPAERTARLSRIVAGEGR